MDVQYRKSDNPIVWGFNRYFSIAKHGTKNITADIVANMADIGMKQAYSGLSTMVGNEISNTIREVPLKHWRFKKK